MFYEDFLKRAADSNLERTNESFRTNIVCTDRVCDELIALQNGAWRRGDRRREFYRRPVGFGSRNASDNSFTFRQTERGKHKEQLAVNIFLVCLRYMFFVGLSRADNWNRSVDTFRFSPDDDDRCCSF